MSYLDWHVGMKVVCVNDNYRVSLVTRRWFGLMKRDIRILHNLNKGDTYTITGMVKLQADGGIELVAIFVDGARHFGLPVEWPFPATLFRKIETRKTDISIFTALLTPAPKQTEPA